MMISNETANRLAYVKIVSWIQSVVDALISPAKKHDAQGAGGTELATARATRLFVRALHENSDLEMDWLWYAANMTRDIERRYCLKRALEINPHSTLARSALAKLAQPGEAAGERARLPSIGGATADRG
jgi:hypothetical protein